MARIHNLIDRYLLILILVAYLLGGVLPEFGLEVKKDVIGQTRWLDGSSMIWTIQAVFLALMLFNSGFSVTRRELVTLVREPGSLILGLAANMAIPALLILIAGALLMAWPNEIEVKALLAGLALIVSMPIAGSSTTWSQSSGGNMGFSLALVLFSTILSPFTTPLVLATVARHLSAGQSSLLGVLSSSNLGAFLVYAIVMPSLAGVACHQALGTKLVNRLKPGLRLASLSILLFLNYANAAIALPRVISNPEWDYLALAGGSTLAFCSLLFLLGWTLPKLAGAKGDVRVSMMFGLGMNNNGSALVIASAIFPTQPLVMLPIIIYNLGQHLVAGAARATLMRPTGD